MKKKFFDMIDFWIIIVTIIVLYLFITYLGHYLVDAFSMIFKFNM